MEMGIVGLGRMGGNMALRLLRKGHRLIVYDRSDEAVQGIEASGAIGARSLDEFVSKFETSPRVMWVMVPAASRLRRRSRRSRSAARLVTSSSMAATPTGGWPLRTQRESRPGGFITSMPAPQVASGGCRTGTHSWWAERRRPTSAVCRCSKTWRPMAADWSTPGSEGSGHFVKMVHNGIEYGLMQAYAEGFEIMKRSKAFPGMDLYAIAEAWREGSVVRSWLLDLIADGLRKDPQLTQIRGYVEDTGEGRWTIQAAIDEDTPAPVITLALYERLRSRVEDSFTDKMLSMMRNQFGGHAVVAQRPVGAGQRS